MFYAKHLFWCDDASWEVYNVTVRKVRRDRGFTLVELLVVLAIMMLLVAILFPALAAARAEANLVNCASNMRQIVIALTNYASENDGKYPPHYSVSDWVWVRDDFIGLYLQGCQVIDGAGALGGGALVCPSDYNSMRSYSMNFWAASKTEIAPTMGTFWASNVRNGDKMILIAEPYTRHFSASTGHFLAPSIVGTGNHRPGPRFGGGLGMTPYFIAGQWGLVNCELDFMRHRKSYEGKGTQPKGRLNFGYADGHVAIKLHTDLVDVSTGLSRLDSWWSPMDPEINQ